MTEIPCSTQYFKANNLHQSEVIEISLSLNSCGLGLGHYLCCRLDPSCYVIFDLEPLSLAFDIVFSFEILKSFSLRSLPSYDLVSWYRHAHTLHHLESLLTISLDNLCLDYLDILRKILNIRAGEVFTFA
uniref:Uncharacterized protein n=1 Tax=Tanacetum cinerariifolium TaxID=118510 RepID=A0A6L2P9N7_TANCI|nr:hypothetical protein [Tanacetum cinerariifolium]